VCTYAVLVVIVFRADSLYQDDRVEDVNDHQDQAHPPLKRGAVQEEDEHDLGEQEEGACNHKQSVREDQSSAGVYDICVTTNWRIDCVLTVADQHGPAERNLVDLHAVHALGRHRNHADGRDHSAVEQRGSGAPVSTSNPSRKRPWRRKQRQIACELGSSKR